MKIRNNSPCIVPRLKLDVYFCCQPQYSGSTGVHVDPKVFYVEKSLSFLDPRISRWEEVEDLCQSFSSISLSESRNCITGNKCLKFLQWVEFPNFKIKSSVEEYSATYTFCLEPLDEFLRISSDPVPVIRIVKL